jgi:hypothetical protein
MHKTKSCKCSCGCHGRKHLTKEEKKERLQHKKECLEKELQGINEALQDLTK